MWLRVMVLLVAGCPALAATVQVAGGGGLKMLYDSRMEPQAVAVHGRVHLVWRDARGLPWMRSYDLATRRFSQPRMVLVGTGVDFDRQRFMRDHHFAPVAWAGTRGRVHVAFGFHRTPGYHFASAAGAPDGDRWERLPAIASSVSYPQVHRIAGDRTLVYYRHAGHLGFWTYATSSDGGRTWRSPERPVVDLDASPRDLPVAAHAGSYHTTRVSPDGKTLHIGFVWKIEDPVASERYGEVLHDHVRRHNLYYLRVDLETGEVASARGTRLRRPINLGTAQRECLVLDTAGGSVSVGPAIEIDEHGEPAFLVPVSGARPYESVFRFVSRVAGEWRSTPLAATGHPFNSGQLLRHRDGSFRALLVAGDGVATASGEMNRYGWGDRIEEWTSDTGHGNWRRTRDLTPRPGLRYQSVKLIRGEDGQPLADMAVFYAWEGNREGRAYLLDERD